MFECYNRWQTFIWIFNGNSSSNRLDKHFFPLCLLDTVCNVWKCVKIKLNTSADKIAFQNSQIKLQFSQVLETLAVQMFLTYMNEQLKTFYFPFWRFKCWQFGSSVFRSLSFKQFKVAVIKIAAMACSSLNTCRIVAAMKNWNFSEINSNYSDKLLALIQQSDPIIGLTDSGHTIGETERLQTTNRASFRRVQRYQTL